MDDQQIIQLFLSRDEQAISQTERKYGKALYLMADRILKDDDDSCECVNDTYLRVWNTIPPTRPTYFSAYLYKIVRTLSIDRFRARKSKKRACGEYATCLDELAECISGEETPENALEFKLLTELIEVFLKGLPKQQRQVFLCRYYFSEPVKSIAKACNMSESKIKTMLYRLRCDLKQYLYQEGFL